MGHAVQVLQNENVCVSENENRKAMVVMRERDALGAKLLQKRCCSSQCEAQPWEGKLGWMEEAWSGALLDGEYEDGRTCWPSACQQSQRSLSHGAVSRHRQELTSCRRAALLGLPALLHPK